MSRPVFDQGSHYLCDDRRRAIVLESEHVRAELAHVYMLWAYRRREAISNAMQRPTRGVGIDALLQTHFG